MKKIFTKIIVFPIFFLANPVFAQDEPPTLSGNIGPIVDKITGYLFPVAVLISLVFVVMEGTCGLSLEEILVGLSKLRELLHGQF